MAKRAAIPPKWRKIIQRIPGYDPIATAGDCWFDPDAAELAIEFFSDCLRHTEGQQFAGKPFVLEPWQASIVVNLFGWKRPSSDLRRYKTCFLKVGRKNGKTAFAAGLVHCVAFTDDEPGAQIYSAAADRDQARLVFEPARRMAEAEPMIRDRVQIYTNAIVYPNGVSYKAISAEAATKHGYNGHLIIVDELHAQKDRELVDVLVTSTASRQQPLIVYITTADFDRPSICNEIDGYAHEVRDGIFEDGEFLPVIYEAIEGEDDWTKVKTWRKANPNLGVSIPVSYLKSECRKAKRIPAYENTFKRLHCNMKTQQDVRWLRLKDWDACAGSVSDEDLEASPAYGGLDLASTDDLTALALYWPALHALRVWFWCPRVNAGIRQERDRVKYLDWANAGYIQLTEGNTLDDEAVEQKIVDLGDRYNIVDIGIDRWNTLHLTNALGGHGFEVVPFGQGFASMSEPSKALEKLVMSAKLRHGGNPVLRWMANNVAVETDAAANIKPSKKKTKEKIDGIVATVMAIGRSLAASEDEGSVYDERGVITL